MQAAFKGPEISIHALLAESDALAMAGYTKAEIISIHALLAESDFDDRVALIPHQHFYPRSPCGERHLNTARIRFAAANNFYPRSPCGERRKEVTMADFDKIFLSTLSLRRATGKLLPAGILGDDFYPRSPCGERRQVHPTFAPVE